jgi:hypothetical protein
MGDDIIELGTWLGVVDDLEGWVHRTNAAARDLRRAPWRDSSRNVNGDFRFNVEPRIWIWLELFASREDPATVDPPDAGMGKVEMANHLRNVDPDLPSSTWHAARQRRAEARELPRHTRRKSIRYYHQVRVAARDLPEKERIELVAI